MQNNELVYNMSQVASWNNVIESLKGNQLPYLTMSWIPVWCASRSTSMQWTLQDVLTVLLHQGLTDLLITELRLSDEIPPECKKITYCEGGQILEQLQREAVVSPSLKISQIQLDTALSNTAQQYLTLLSTESWTR